MWHVVCLALVRFSLSSFFERDFRLKKEANALRGEETRQSARTVKAAGLAFIEAMRRALTEQAGGSGAGFSQEGQKGEKSS
jgi:hypothetical protein